MLHICKCLSIVLVLFSVGGSLSPVNENQKKVQDENSENTAKQMKTMISLMQAVLSKLKRLERQNYDLETRTSALENTQASGLQANVPGYAFYLRKVSSMQPNSVDVNINYENVILNHGGGWITANPQFIAPVKGVYVFHIHSTSWGGSESLCETAIKQNGVIVAVTSATGTGNVQGDTAVVVLMLEQYDIITAVLLAGRYLQGSGYSSFSGFLLSQNQPYSNDKGVNRWL